MHFPIIACRPQAYHLLVAAGLLVAGAASQQAPITLCATLRGQSTVPPNASTATGTAFARLTPATGQLAITVTTRRLAASTMAHLHQGAAGTNGSVLFTMTGGNGQWTLTGTLTQPQVSAMLAGDVYVDVHSTSQPSGEIRGQFAPAVMAFGLAHWPVGGAQLAAAPTTLNCSGIGSSGHDGVECAIAELKELHCTYQEPLTAGMPTGSFLAHEVHGVTNGAPATVRHRIELSGGSRVFSADFTEIGATAYEATYLLNGGIVGQVVRSSGTSYLTANGPSNPPPKQEIKASHEAGIAYVVCLGEIVVCGNCGGTRMNEIRLRPLQPQPFEGRVLTTLASGPISMTILGGGTAVGGLHLRALGTASLRGDPRGLGPWVDIIGSSGGDGIECALLDAQSAHLDIAGLSPSAAVGAELEMQIDGVLGRVPGASLGSLIVRKTATGHDLIDHFGSINTNQQIVEVLLRGQSVHTSIRPTGLSASCASPPERIGKRGGETECIVGRWGAPNSIVVGGVTWVGDELRLLAIGGTPVDSKTTLRVVARGYPQFAVTAAEAVYFESFGGSCSGSNGVVGNQMSGSPRLDHTVTMTFTNLNPTLSVAVGMIGLSNTVSSIGPLPFDLGIIGAPGCPLSISPDFTTLVIGSGGSAALQLPLPSNPSLVFTRLYTQCLSLDPPANAAGLTTSPAGTFVIGR